jgi:hypothetical protein
MQDFQGKGKTKEDKLNNRNGRRRNQNTILRIKLNNLQDKVTKLKKIILKKEKKENIIRSQAFEHFIYDY